LNGAHEQIEASGAELTLIGQATPKHAAHYKRRYAPDLEILADQDRKSYKAMKFPRASTAQLIGPKSVAKGLVRGATGVGVGRPIGDVAQLGGTALIAEDGKVVWTHVQQDASDNPSIEELLEALNENLG
jgi:prostamide/prostaglandin F2alpha synthase